MVGPACCEKLSLKRGVWTAEEDAKILAFVSKHGSGNWTSVPKKAGLKRCGKSCRLRWTNYLRPDLKHDSFTPQEEDLIVRLHSAIGSRWSIIAQQLPGRTDNDVKNYWNTKLKKKLSEMGIDPVTHKPFSKLLADYGYIGGLQKPSTRIGSLSKDFKNAVLLKSELFPTPPQGIRSIHSHPKQPSTSQKMEPTEDSFLCNRSHVQFQAIPKVSGASNFINMTEKETIPVAIFGEGLSFLSSTSSPSTSSTCSTAAQEGLSVPFSWNDFLLEDVLFSPAADNQEQESITGFLSKDFVSHKDDVTMTENMKEVGSESQQVPISSDFQFSSSSDISFVEDMLDRENEMFLNFPHLMEEPSNY